MPTFPSIPEARRLTAGLVRRTPLVPAPDLGRRTGAEVYLKLENQQVTGSFKARGPALRLQSLRPDEKRRGVVAATAGNHGIGLSHAGRQLGVPVHIHIAESADRDKLELLRDNGAILHFAPDYEAAHFNALAMAERDGLVRVSAYSDHDVIASNGVVGLEIQDDLPGVDLVIVPVGGGGLVSGISLAMKEAAQPVEVWGVEAAVSPTFTTWHREGASGPVKVEESIAEGLSGYVEPDTLTWPVIRDHVHRVSGASEQELVGAMGWMVRKHRMIIEPSAGAAIAAVLAAGTSLSGRRVVAVISGGNVAWDRFRRLLSEYPEDQP